MNEDREQKQLAFNKYFEAVERSAKIQELEATVTRLEGERDTCSNSVTEASVRFPNVGEYIRQLEAERDALKAENVEQARLLGMSVERECSLRAELDRARKDNQKLHDDYFIILDKVMDQRDAYRAELDRARKLLAEANQYVKAIADSFSPAAPAEQSVCVCVGFFRDENDNGSQCPRCKRPIQLAEGK